MYIHIFNVLCTHTVYIPLLATAGDVFISLSNMAAQIFRMPPQRSPSLPWALHCLDLGNGSVFL